MAGILPLNGINWLEVVSSDAPSALGLSIGMCGRIAHDLGATVTRICASDFKSEDPAAETFLNLGKTRLAVNKSQYVSLINDMALKSVVLVGDVSAMEQLQPLNRNQIGVAIGMQQDAPMSGTEFSVEAGSGLLDMVGDPHRQPLRLGGHQTSYAAGLAGFLSASSALPNIEEATKAQIMRVDLLDVAVWLNWKSITVAMEFDRTLQRAGNEAEWLTLPCADGYFALVYRPGDWGAIKQIFRDERLEDPRFQTVQGRRDNMTEVNSLLRDLFSKMRRREIHELSLKLRIPFGPVLSPNDLVQDPHMQAREFFQTISIDGEDRKIPSVPVKWNGQNFVTSTDAA